MKDIIRQAVADAVQALFCEFGYFESVLKEAEQQGIMGAAIAECGAAGNRKRAEQMRLANIKTLSIHCDAWPESAHLAAIEGKTVTLGFDPAEATPDQLRKALAPHAAMVARQTFIACAAPALSAIVSKVSEVLVVGPGGFVPRACMQATSLPIRIREKAREECADAAQSLVMNEGYDSKFLIMQGAQAIIYYAQVRKSQRENPEPEMVSVPRWLLEEAELCLRQTGENVSLSADLRKYL